MARDRSGAIYRAGLPLMQQTRAINRAATGPADLTQAFTAQPLCLLVFPMPGLKVLVGSSWR